MRIAIIHDSYLHVGGAEKVLDTLLDMYPHADTFIPIVNLKLFKKKHSTNNLKTTFFSYIPFLHRYASFLKPFCIIYFESLNLSDYKIAITSSHSFNSKIINAENIPHISYVHTPPRYLDSQLYNESQIIHNKYVKKIFKPIINWLRKKDQESGKKPNLIIANSKNVQKRILSRYKRNSIVIYPPIKLSKLTSKTTTKKEHFLVFSRLVKQKGVDLAIKAFNKNGEKLIIVGTGPEYDNLKEIANDNISLLGYVSNATLKKIFLKTKAMINCSIDEDFGMVNIEALSYGIPVIGYYSGGTKEAIIDSKTGLFFYKRTINEVNNAIKKFYLTNFKKEDCIMFAQTFNKRIFVKKIRSVIEKYTY